MSLFEKNLRLLQAHDPALARKVKIAPLPEWIRIAKARDGHPILKVESVTLHSTYRPLQEAAAQVSGFTADERKRTVVYGLGLGYHVLQFLRSTAMEARRESLNQIRPNPDVSRTNPSHVDIGSSGTLADITVIEPSLSIFRAFVESVDIAPFLPRTRFIVDQPPARILSRLLPGEWNVFRHPTSVQISRNYFDLVDKGREVNRYLGNHRLRILVVNPIYGGSLPSARFCASALNSLGHDAVSVECEKFEDGFSLLREITRNPGNAKVLSDLFMNLMGETILARAADFRPDLVLALAQAPLTGDKIVRLQQQGIPVAFWFVEDIRTLTYWKEIAPAYDYFFSIQKGEALAEFKAHGARNCYYLPQGCLPEIHRPLAPKRQERYGSDLSFMGAAYHNRVQSFLRLLDFDFKIWGTGWNLESPVGSRVQNGNRRVDADTAVKIYNASRINLNLHSSSWHEGVNPNGDLVNPRTFEIAACSAFQLVDAREEMDELFRVGEEIVTFSSIDELKEKCAYYLKHDAERNKIAARACVRANLEHTLQHRMQEMLIHIFSGRFDELKGRMEKRRDALAYFKEQAGENTELLRTMEQFQDESEFSLKKIVAHIEKGEGALSGNEILLLMLDQVVEEKG